MNQTSNMARDYGAVTVGKNGRSLQFAFVDISPALALRWLDLEHPDNRHSSAPKITDYSLTMGSDKWNALTAECLKFDVLGRLIDGGHRLRALLVSGKTVTMLVCWGLPVEAFHIIDQGRPRTKLWWEGSDITSTVQILAKFKDGNCLPNRSTQVRLVSLLDQHRAAIVFACDLFATRRRGITAMVRAIVARASYHTDPELLAEFAGCLYGRRLASTPNRQFLISRLAAFLVANPARNNKESSRYRKLDRALKAFIDDDPVSKFYEAPGELFSLPGEQES